jgi:hypothetical protein
MPSPLSRPRVEIWTQERIEALSTPEVRQLLLNAERLAEPEIAARCGAILDARPRGRAPVRTARRKAPAPAED